MECRWPPVYDFEGLGEEINRLVKSSQIFGEFFHTRNLDSCLCQGDVLNFPGQFPFIDENGNITILDEDYDYWLILGNTCDLDRDLPSPHLSHITPLIPLEDDVPDDVFSGLRSYSSYKKFYLPAWDSSGKKGFTIDFTQIGSVDKKCLINFTDLAARLTFKSWHLLHSCLVRYLARDDGRHD